MADDLNAPLGQHKRKRLLNLPVSAPQLLAGALGLSGVVVVAWAAFVNDPLGGEPTAVVATKTPPSTQSARDGDRDGKQHARHDGEAGSAPNAPEAAAKAVEAPPPGSRTACRRTTTCLSRATCSPTHADTIRGAGASST